MKIKINYELGNRKFTTIEIEEEHKDLVKELNKDIKSFDETSRLRRNKSTSLNKLQEEYDFEYQSDELDPFEELCNQENLKEKETYSSNLKEDINNALDNLSEKQKYIFIEHIYKDRKISDIAKELNISRQAVLKTYNTAKEKLKENLIKYKK